MDVDAYRENAVGTPMGRAGYNHVRKPNAQTCANVLASQLLQARGGLCWVGFTDPCFYYLIGHEVSATMNGPQGSLCLTVNGLRSPGARWHEHCSSE